ATNPALVLLAVLAQRDAAQTTRRHPLREVIPRDRGVGRLTGQQSMEDRAQQLARGDGLLCRVRGLRALRGIVKNAVAVRVPADDDGREPHDRAVAGRARIGRTAERLVGRLEPLECGAHGPADVETTVRRAAVSLA